MMSKIKNFLFVNKTVKQTVAKNTFWLTVSNFGGRLIKAAVVIYGARVLGAAGYGIFSYAITLAGFLTIFLDPGINSILVRDISKSNEEERQSIFSTMLIVKVVLIIIGASIIIFVAPSFSTLPGAKIILPVVATILALDTFREFLTSLLRAQEKMEWDAAIFLLTNTGILIFGFIFLSIQKSATSFAWAYIPGDIAGIALAGWAVKKYFKNPFAHFSLKRIGPILNAAWPFAVASALGGLLTSADILILSWMKNASDVGIYSAAIRIVGTLYLVPTILQYSILPLFARSAAEHDNARLRSALERIIGVIFLTAIPLAIGGGILATQIMGLVFGPTYNAGGPAFSILLIGLLFDFPTVVISSAIFAYNRQRSLIVTSLIAAATNIVLDILLIPRFGMTGSAIATLVAQILSAWYLWRIMTKINDFKIISYLGKLVGAGIIMGIVCVSLLAFGINVVINMVISGEIYFLVLAILHEPLLIETKKIVFADS